MYKNISGQNINNNQILNDITSFKKNMVNTIDCLANSKRKLDKIKESNNQRKDQIENSNIAKMIFTKMKKRNTFLPTVHKSGYINNPNQGVDKNEPFRDARKTITLIFPRRILDNTKLWAYSKSSLNLIKLENRLPKLMGSKEINFLEQTTRLINTLREKENNELYRSQDGRTKRANIEIKNLNLKNWTKNGNDLREFNHEYFLKENLTPRAIRKKITLAKIFEKAVWNPVSNTLKEFKSNKKKK